jgi:hypothetical protein
MRAAAYEAYAVKLIHFVVLWCRRLPAGDWGAALRVTNL